METHNPDYTERAILIAGYQLQIGRRPLLAPDYSYCATEEAAYFYQLENLALTIPDELQFPNIEELIPEEHHQRIGGIWQKVLKASEDLHRACSTLKIKWDRAPETHDPTIKKVIESIESWNPPHKVAAHRKKAIMAVISPFNSTPALNENIFYKPSAADIFKVEEKALRLQYFTKHKNYITVLRIYYEMLREKSEDGQTRIIPEKNPLRIILRRKNRLLRVVDVVHQSVAIAKTSHHHQKKDKLRKSGSRVPYIFHPLAVTETGLMDILPHVIEEKDPKIDLTLFGTVGPLHDIIEDTKINFDDLATMTASVVDKYDSSFMQEIESGFGRETADFKKNTINLIGPERYEKVVKILRILSNNTELSDEENKHVKKSTNHYEARKDYYDDGKMLRFLNRLEAISDSGEITQIALITKIEDRANNIATMDGMDIDFKLKTLRPTVTRLLDHIMTGNYDFENFPLYGALARLINECIKGYENLETRDLQEIDHENIAKLTKWRRELIERNLHYPEPQKVTDIMRAFRERIDQVYDQSFDPII